MSPSYSFTLGWNNELYAQRLEAALPSEKPAWESLRALYQAEEATVDLIHTPHTVGGKGYTHAIVNYGRVLAEGLDGYAARIEAGLARAQDEAQADFYRALSDLLAGVRTWQARLLAAVCASPVQSVEKDRLAAALRQVPFKPARNYYEAVVAYNLVYYLDGCDNPGRMDQVLWPYYQSDPSLDRAEALAYLRAFFTNVSENGGWSLAIGGSAPGGEPSLPGGDRALPGGVARSLPPQPGAARAPRYA